MLCTFKPNGAGPEETYSGEIKKVGTQTELDGKLVLIWAVMGPGRSRDEARRCLEQTLRRRASAVRGRKVVRRQRLLGRRER